MNEEYLKSLYDWLSNTDVTYPKDVPYEQFIVKMQDPIYVQKMHQWIVSKDQTFGQDLPLDAFKNRIGLTPVGISTQVKKKEDTTALPSGVGSLVSSVSAPDQEALRFAELVKKQEEVAGQRIDEPGYVDPRKKLGMYPTQEQINKATTQRFADIDASQGIQTQLDDVDYFQGAFGNMLRGFDKVSQTGFGDLVDDIGRSLASGYLQGDVAQAANSIIRSGNEFSEEDIQNIIDNQEKLQQLGSSKEFQDYQKTYEEEGKTIWGAVKGLMENPTVFPEVMASSITSMATNRDAVLAGLGTLAAAFGAGAATGGTGGSFVVPGVGTVVGAVGAGLSAAASSLPYAFGAASTVVETGATFAQLLQEELGTDESGNPIKPTKENVRAILEDPEKYNKIKNDAIARGFTVGIIDAVGGKLATGVGAKILKSSAKATGNITKKGLVSSLAAGGTIESGTGAIGEAAGQAIIGKPIEISEVILEAASNMPGTLGTTLMASLKVPTYKINKERVSAEEIDTRINTMTPEQLAASDIEVYNDFEGRKEKIQDKIVTGAIRNEIKSAQPDLNEPTVNAIVELQKELNKLEGNKTQVAKDKAAQIRADIKNLQENPLPEPIAPVAKPSYKVNGEEVSADVIDNLLETKSKEELLALNIQISNDTEGRVDKFQEIIQPIKPQEYAVQEQAAGQIPVQPTTTISEEVAQGEPQAEPQVTAEEGKAKEITGPLKDVKSTAAALNEDLINRISEEADIFFPSTEDLNTRIAESYHKAKADGSNPNLVNAVEKVLGTVFAEPQVAAEVTVQEEVIPTETKVSELEKEKSKLTSKALKQFPQSPAQLKTRARIDEINTELKSLKAKPEAKAQPSTAPITITDIKVSFAPENAIEIKKETVEDARGRKFSYDASVTSQATDQNGTPIGIITKRSDADGKLSFTLKNTSGQNINKGKAYPTERDARVALAEQVNRIRAKAAPVVAPAPVNKKASEVLANYEKGTEINLSELETVQPPSDSVVKTIFDEFKKAFNNITIVGKRATEGAAFYDTVKKRIELNKNSTHWNQVSSESLISNLAHEFVHERIDNSENKKQIESDLEKIKKDLIAKPPTFANENDKSIFSFIVSKNNSPQEVLTYMVSNPELRKYLVKHEAKLNEISQQLFGIDVIQPQQIKQYEQVQPQRRGDGREGRPTVSKITPLQGAPKIQGATGPDEQLVSVAEKYAADNKIELKRQGEYVEVDENRAKRLADAYEEMANDPSNPKVKEAYAELIKQTKAQYQALIDAGYKFWFIDLNNPNNIEYISSPYNAMRDLRQNKEMGVFPTEQGFGTDETVDVSKNPLLEDTGLMWPSGGLNGPMKSVTANDLFRAVHDAFGHGLEGAGFRARGEENAWQAHVRLFTGPAIGAMTSETRGQNSWVNYGPYGEKNRNANSEDTVYADQKTGLMPEWTWTEGRAADMESAPVQEKAGKKKAVQTEDIIAEEEKSKGVLESTFDFLDALDKDVSNTLKTRANDVLLGIPLTAVQGIIKGLKVLVKGGMKLRDAIKKIAADNNISQDTLKDLLNLIPIQEEFNKVISRADELITRQRSKKINDKKILTNLEAKLRKEPAYINGTDAQRKIMEREVRAKMGAEPRKAASIGRVIGELKDITNVTREEKLKIISRIRELGKDVGKELAKEIRAMKVNGQITTAQATNIISRLTKVNPLNETSVSNFVDYMAEVFANVKEKNRQSLLRDLVKLVSEKAKTAKTESGKRRSKGLDAVGQAFFDAIKPIINAAANNDVETLQKIKDSIDNDLIQELMIKTLNGQELTTRERVLLDQALAYDTFADVANMKIEQIQELYNQLKNKRTESIANLKSKRIERAEQTRALHEEVNEQIKKGFGVLYNEDGTLKNDNQLRAESDAIWDSFQNLKIWDGVKKLFERYDFTISKNIFDFIRKTLSHIGTISKTLDKGGEFFTDNVYRALNKMDTAHLEGYFNEMEVLDEMANKIDGITKGYKQFRSKMSNKVITLDNIKDSMTGAKWKNPINQDQAMRIYALYKNPIQKEKLIRMGFDEANMQKIEDFIGTQGKQMADMIVDYFSNEYYESVNKVYRQVNDVSLGYVENYFPTQTIATGVGADMIIDGNFSGIFDAETAPSLKERTDKKSDVALGAAFTDVVESHIQTMERYKAYAEGVKRINSIFKSPAVKTLLGRYGTELNSVYKSLINFAINPNGGAKIQQTTLDKVMNKFAGFALAFKLIQIPKQATSFITAFEDYNYRGKGKKRIPGLDTLMFMVDTAKTIATLPIQVRKAQEISASFRDRLAKGLEGDVYGLESGSLTFKPIGQRNTLWGRISRALKKGAGFPTVMGDILGVMGYMINYNRNIANGMSKEDALEAFNNYNATQQSRRAADKIPLQQSQSALGRAFTMFGSTTFLQINKVIQGMTNIMRSLKEKKMPDAKDMRAVALNFGLANAFFVLASNMSKFIEGDDEDRERVLQLMGEALIGLNLIYQIPLLGGAVEVAIKKAKGDRSPTSDVINPYITVFNKIYKGVQEDDLIKSGQPIIEIILGTQLDQFVGLYNLLGGDFKSENVYDALGITKSFRPGESKSTSKKSDQKGMTKAEMKKQMPKMYEEIYGETDEMLKEIREEKKKILEEAGIEYEEEELDLE